MVKKDEADRIRQMFKLASAGKRPTEIAEFANAQGWRTRKPGKQSGEWTARQVLKLLSNPTYAGLIRNGEETRPGRHPAIVTQELFDQVRDTISSRRSRKPGRSQPTTSWPLRGLLKCGRCGRGMNPSESGYRNVRYRYYRCRSNAGGRAPCKGVCLPALEIEQFVSRTICEMKPVKKLWQALDERTQLKALPDVVHEVVFDPAEETVQVTLVEDAVELLSCGGE